MTGRPMRGTVVIDSNVLDDQALDRWIGQARGYVAGLPPRWPGHLGPQPAAATTPAERRAKSGHESRCYTAVRSQLIPAGRGDNLWIAPWNENWRAMRGACPGPAGLEPSRPGHRAGPCPVPPRVHSSRVAATGGRRES